MKPAARKSPQPGPYGIEPRRRKRKPRSAGRPAPRKPAGRIDPYNLVAAAMGAFCGLVIYSLVTPGYLPDEAPAALVGSRLNDLALLKVDGKLAKDGMYRIEGQLFNKVEQPCRYASVTIRFYDRAGELVTRRSVTAENIAAGALKPFATEAYVPSAVRYEVAVDLAHF